ncbi:phage tail tape measure protein [Virgibacillus salexigens]|uniref:Phage tail tape measure protein, TP901 family, core region n=1 Tax=Virgibacillus massiliensis TaxID=1462526 RepID=A0A024Q9Y0_9BACI|nr:phage tail tape measure protein [Virgibacillus massiliensis]CDQ39072.1 phage tail tape measure protein, TP901 family, core region [Virgibacillus massiliensis]
MIGDVLVRIGADISDYDKNIKKAADRMQEFGSNISSVGSTIAAGFGAIAAGSALAVGSTVKAAAEWEDSFASVRKTVDGTEADFARLAKGIRDMSEEVPASANSIAEVAAVAGQLGVKSDDILKFTRTMVDLGETTNLSSEDAAQSLAQFANVVGMSMDDIDRLGSVIVDLGNNMATNEDKIVSMAQRLAGAGAQINLSESDILAFSAALSSVGLEAEMAGSAFSRVFLEMNTAVMDGGKELQKFAKIAGMSADDFATAFEDDAAGAITTFLSGLGKIGKEGGNTTKVLDDLGFSELRVRDTLLRASEASGLFSDALNIGSNAWKENTALAKEANTRYETFISKLKMVRNRVKNIASLIGGPFMDVLSGMLDALDPVISAVERFAEWFNDASQPMKTFITTAVLLIPVIAAIGAGIGLLLMALGGLVGTIGVASIAFGGLGGAALVVGKVILGLIGAFTLLPAAIAGIVVAAKNFDKIKAKASDMATSIANSVASLAKLVKESLEDFAQAFADKFPVAAKAVQKFADSVKDFSVGAFEKALSGLGTLGELAAKGLDVLKESGITVTDVLRNLAGPMTSLVILLGGLAGPIGWVVSGLTFLATRTNIVTDMIKVFKGEMEFSEAIENMGDMVVQFINKLSEMLTASIETGTDIIVKLIEGITAALPGLIDTATQIITLLIEKFTELLPVLIETGLGLVLKLIEGIVSALPMVIETATKLFTTLVETIFTLLPMLIETGIQILMTLIDAIITNLPLIIEMAITLITTIIQTLVENLPRVVDAGINILTSLIDGIIQSLPALLDAALQLIMAILDVIVENLPVILQAGVDILMALIDGIISILPTLLDAALEILFALVDVFIDNLPKLFDAGVEILFALIDGIIEILPELLEAGGKLITELIKALMDMLPDIFDAGVELIGELIDGLLDMLPDIGEAAAEIGGKLLDGIGDFAGDMFDAGKDLLGGLKRGIEDKADDVVSAAQSVAGRVESATKRFFGIKSPSRMFRNDIGKMLGEGLALGIKDEISNVTKMAQRLSEAATPEQPKLAGIDIGDFRGQSKQMTARLQAEVNRGSYGDSGGTDNGILAEIRDELRRTREVNVNLEADNEWLRAKINEGNAVDASIGRYFP